MKPPRLADRLLARMLPLRRLEEVQGDLHEEFCWQVNRIGERRARWRYWWDVLGFVRQALTTSKQSADYSQPSYFSTAMFLNYLAIAYRQLRKNPLFSAINILGLTAGLAVSTFIALYVWHEFHYDRFHPFADRTYRIMSASKFGDDEVTFLGLHESFGTAVKKEIPEVETVTRISEGMGDVVLQSAPQRRFKEENIGFADASTLGTFGFRLLQGDLKTALSEPGRIVLTQKLAEKYFGSQNPIGQPITYDKHYPLTVSGVLENLPSNTEIRLNALVSLSSMPTLSPHMKSLYESAGFLHTFLILRPGANPGLVEKKLQKIKAGIKFVDMSAKYYLEVLPSLHLDSRSTAKDNRQALYVLLTVALLILTLAIINYISLTTARATKRAREVGVRKAIGSQRSELISQFFTESFLTTTLAFGLALLVLQLLFPWANQALSLKVDNQVLLQGPYWGLMLILWLGCSILAGSYPALLLSRFKPHDVLKGTMGSGRSGSGVRQFFTTFQFTASIGLLICSVVLYAQMHFLKTKNLGINRSQVVSIKIDGEMSRQFLGFRDAVRQWAGHANVAATNTALYTNRGITYFMETEKTKKKMMVKALSVDKSFFGMMGVQMIHAPVGWDSKPVTRDLRLYNQITMKEAGINTNSNPLQQPPPFKSQPADGIVADFHVQSLHGPVSPMMIHVVSDTSQSIMENGGYLLVRLGAHTDVTQALTHLRTLYTQTQPLVPFDYYFLDEAYDRLYAKEERMMRLFNSFTGLTLLVACLGLLGLMTFSVEVRNKEIGIRKVLGASVAGIVVLLSKDFLKLMLIAILIASPIAWYAMDKWLQDFAYKIQIEWWMVAVAGALTLCVALAAVSFQSIKAALTNPAKSLRSE